MKKICLTLLGCLLSSLSFATEIPMTTAVLRGLDKVTGRIKTFEIPVGGVGQFGRTFVAVESCFTHPPEESPENSAFLYIYEKSLKGENIELFKGWMFSSDPALSSMEHPVYDVWVLSCKGEAKSGVQEDVKAEPEDKTVQPEQKTEETTSSENIVPSEVEVEDLH